MAVHYERLHTECLGQCERLLIMSFGQSALRAIAMGCDLTKEVSSIHLMAPFVVLSGKC